jgi:hypothetical protein
MHAIVFLSCHQLLAAHLQGEREGLNEIGNTATCRILKPPFLRGVVLFSFLNFEVVRFSFEV